MAFSLRSVLFASTTLTVLTSCGGQDTADALIGPEGGVVAHDNGIPRFNAECHISAATGSASTH